MEMSVDKLTVGKMTEDKVTMNPTSLEKNDCR
jgi:hypothetical protein